MPFVLKGIRNLIVPIFIIAFSTATAQEQVLFKQVDTTKLIMEVFRPVSMESSKKYPAMVFFFGGGWNGGTLKHFEPQAKYFS